MNLVRLPFGMGFIALNLIPKNPDKEIKELRAATEAGSAKTWEWLRLLSLLLHKGDCEGVLDQCEKILAAGSSPRADLTGAEWAGTAARFYRGSCYERTGDLEAAVLEYESAGNTGVGPYRDLALGSLKRLSRTA